ncbi:MAG: uroporphyrinogen decarboxylase family protein [Candidatus Fimadaptatus sp.]
MTNRERVIAALEFSCPDRTPYDVSFTGQMYKKMVDYTGQSDFGRDINGHISSVYLIKPERPLGNERFMDEFGVVWNKSGADKDIGVIDGLVLPSPEALSDFELPPVDEGYIRARMDDLMRESGDNFRIAAIGFSLFERAWTLCGMENLLCYMMTDPDFVHELMGRICERNLKIIDIALEYDIDCFHFGDDWGQQRGLIMGPRCWREFILPYLSRMYARVHAAGKYVSQHSCGDIREVMDDVIDAGLNMYNTYQPEIYTRDYARGLHGRLTIWGGISTQVELPCKTPEEIYAITRDWMSRFPDGGLVCAPTHAIPGDVPPENVLAMLRAMEE